MHELQIATEIISIVRREMSARGLSVLAEIGLRVGDLSGVDPHALAFSFEAAVMGTPLEHTTLKVERVPVHAECRDCAHDFDVSEYLFVCPVCGSTNVKVTAGEELDIAWLSANPED